MLKLNSLLSYLSLILFISCSSDMNKNIPTFTVFHTNFENSLTVDGFVEPVKTSTANCPPNVQGTITYLVDDGTYVHEGDTVCKIEVKEIQTDYEDLLIELENTIAGLNKTKASLDLQYAILEAQVENNNANTKIAQLDSLQLIYSPPNIRKIKELQLKKAAIQKQQYDNKLKALNIINQSEIRRWELRINRIKNRIRTQKERLDALNVKAPKSGLAIIAPNYATDLKNQVGDIVWSNMLLVSIPKISEMKIRMRASETDYKYINVNDSVVYTFDAMPENKAWGKIQLKSPIGVPYRRGSKIKLFEIEATIDSVITMPAPGYTANCRIILQEVKDTLVVPQVAVFDEDSLKVVYVKNKNGFEMRQVKTGLSSSKEVIITSGLKENEVVALTKPDESLIKSKKTLGTDVSQIAVPRHCEDGVRSNPEKTWIASLRSQ